MNFFRGMSSYSHFIQWEPKEKSVQNLVGCLRHEIFSHSLYNVIEPMKTIFVDLISTPLSSYELKVKNRCTSPTKLVHNTMLLVAKCQIIFQVSGHHLFDRSFLSQ